MSHPFFDTSSYPWHLPQANTLWKVLYKTIPDFGSIDRYYKSCAPDLEGLTQPAGPAELWQEVLNKLAHSGAVRTLCYTLLKEKKYEGNGEFQDALRAVIEACVAKTDAPPEFGRRRSFVGAGVAAMVGFSIGSAAGYFLRDEVAPSGSTVPESGRIVPPVIVPNGSKGSEPRVLPPVVVRPPKDPDLRKALTAAELAFLNNNVDATKQTTVLTVEVGPWTAAMSANVHIRPIEYEKEKKFVYDKTHAVVSRGVNVILTPTTWDEDGVLRMKDFQGQPGDRLFVLVVVPVTPVSEPLLSRESTMKRFLCVEVTP